MTTPTDVSFVDQSTVIPTAWLNGVNDWTYGAYGVLGETFTATAFASALGGSFYGAGAVTTNTALGLTALDSNTSGSTNVAIGNAALTANTTGTSNIAVGASALQANTTGGSNVGVGLNALFANTTGICNVGLGQNSLLSNTSGSGNTSINPQNSAGATLPVFNPTTENNRFCAGSTSVTNAYIQVAWTVVSDARDKTEFSTVPHGLSFVNQLRPISYRFKVSRDSDVAHGPVRFGFRAQDVLALEGDNPVIVDAEDPEKLRMVDTALIPVLVNAIQELSAEFNAYKAVHP